MMKLSTTALCLSWAIALAAAVPLTPGRAEDTAAAKDDVVTKPVGRTSSGVPVADVSLKYGVSAEGLDLNSSAGAAELEKRVNDAAQMACKQIDARYPNATTSDAECVKVAVDKAMVRVRELVAEAHKKSVASR